MNKIIHEMVSAFLALLMVTVGLEPTILIPKNLFLGPRSFIDSYAEGLPLPQTPQEAVRQIQQYAARGKVPDTPLHVTVALNFFVTEKPEQGWKNESGETGFYGKVLPPLILQDGRCLVPIVGDLYETKMIDEVIEDPETIQELQWLKEAEEEAFITEMIRVKTLRSLLYILSETGDLVFAQFLAKRQITFDQLISKIDSEFLSYVPSRIFYHADQIHWRHYWEKNKHRREVQTVGKIRWEHHVDHLLYEKWKIENEEDFTNPKWDRLKQIPDASFEIVAAPMFRYYEKLGDYLEIEWADRLKSLTTGSWKVFLLMRRPSDFFRFQEEIWVEVARRMGSNPTQWDLTLWWHKLRDFEKLEAAWNRRNAKPLSEFKEDLQKHRKVQVTVTKFTDQEIRKRFGLVRVKDNSGKPIIVKAYTYRKGVVGRLAFLYGEGGFVATKSPEGIILPIDSPRSFDKALSQGWEFLYVKGRLDLKAMGTPHPQLYQFKSNGKRVVLDGVNVKEIEGSENQTLFKQLWGKEVPQPKLRVILEHEGEQKEIGLEELLEYPGIIFGSKYQPGFLSPSGTEVAYQSQEVLQAERRMEELGGEIPYQTFSRFQFSPELAGSLRLTRVEPELSLRLEEAIVEYQIDPANSQLGRWKRDGVLEERLNTFFKNFGRNQRSLLAIGKVWIRLGQKLLHNQDKGKVLTMEETYRFFLKNTDLSGRQADLGDFMMLCDESDYMTTIHKSSLTNEDVRESIAIAMALASQFVLDLEKQGILSSSSQARQKWLRSFAEGFLGRNPPSLEIPELVSLDQVIYERVFKKMWLPQEYGAAVLAKYPTHTRKPLSTAFENLVDRLYGSLRELLEKYWLIRDVSYDASQQVTYKLRFSPYDSPSSGRFQRLARSLERVRESSSEPKTVAELLELKDYRTAVLEAFHVAKGSESPNLLPLLKAYSDTAELIQALDHAFAMASPLVWWKGKRWNVVAALEAMNARIQRVQNMGQSTAKEKYLIPHPAEASM